MDTTLANKKYTWWILMPVAVLLSAIVLWWVFPDVFSRLFEYYARMLARAARSMFPFILIHIGIAGLVFAIEAVVVGWTRSSLYRLFHPDRSMVSDICIFFVNALQLDYVIVFLLTLGVVHKLKIGIRAALDLDQGLLATAIASPVVQFMVYIIIADFILYLEHYLHHRLSFLWPFHSYHHSASELNVLTANRGHPVQSELSNGLIAVIPLTLIGVPLVSLLAFRLLRNTLTFMQHSRLPWHWGWIGRYVFVSPGYHRIHHSVLPEHYDKNLAVIFPLWDHLFGTFYTGTTPSKETGLPDNEYNQKSFLHDMTVPFRMLFRSTENGQGQTQDAMQTHMQKQ